MLMLIPACLFLSLRSSPDVTVAADAKKKKTQKSKKKQDER